MNTPNCPKCNSEYTYQDGALFICPECSNEFSKLDIEAAREAELVRDSNGNILENGDSVVVIKDLKVKGASSDLKQGTKIKNIRLASDGIHNMECKVDGFGAIYVKSEYVKKV